MMVLILCPSWAAFDLRHPLRVPRKLDRVWMGS